MSARCENGYEVALRAAEAAHPLFVHHGWTYGWRDPHVPTVDELLRAILGLLRTCGNEFGDATSSGRFYVERRPEGVEVHLNLGTVLSSTPGCSPGRGESGEGVQGSAASADAPLTTNSEKEGDR